MTFGSGGSTTGPGAPAVTNREITSGSPATGAQPLTRRCPG
jgi:hypothetical protein